MNARRRSMFKLQEIKTSQVWTALIWIQTVPIHPSDPSAALEQWCDEKGEGIHICEIWRSLSTPQESSKSVDAGRHLWLPRVHGSFKLRTPTLTMYIPDLWHWNSSQQCLLGPLELCHLRVESRTQILLCCWPLLCQENSISEATSFPHQIPATDEKAVFPFSQVFPLVVIPSNPGSIDWVAMGPPRLTQFRLNMLSQGNPVKMRKVH